MNARARAMAAAMTLALAASSARADYGRFFPDGNKLRDPRTFIGAAPTKFDGPVTEDGKGVGSIKFDYAPFLLGKDPKNAPGGGAALSGGFYLVTATTSVLLSTTSSSSLTSISRSSSGDSPMSSSVSINCERSIATSWSVHRPGRRRAGTGTRLYRSHRRIQATAQRVPPVHAPTLNAGTATSPTT